MEAERQEALLKEYEMCQAAASHQNTIAWQIGAIFIGATIVAMSWSASRPSRADLDYSLFTTVIALGSIALLWFWYGAYRRWGFFIEVAERRMQEIEAELGLWKNRYVDFLDRWDNDPSQNKAKLTSSPPEDQERLGLLIDWAKQKRFKIARTSVHRWVFRIILSLTGAWFILIVRSWIVFLAP